MNFPQNEIEISPWKRTLEKQQRLLLKREQRGKELENASNEYDTPLATADTASDVSDDSKGVLGLRLAPPSAVMAIKPTVMPIPVPIPVHTVSVDSDVNQVSTSVSPTVSRSRSEPLMPAMDSGKTGPCSNSTYYEDNSEELICRAMTLFVISSPLTPAPRKSAVHTTSPFTPPGRQQKYYVVSAGKRTGVFDSWLYLTLLIYSYPSGLFISK
ncbi:hypothetical protein F5888DRAFT_1802375 [Russula emetica]|nr:hypothetical protein F5888DRAFT_1802375 [Russula emetica]